MKKTSINKRLSLLEGEMYSIAIDEVERLARKCLRQNPTKTTKFVMAMGTFFFTDKNDKVMWDHVAEKLSGYKPLDDFICEWNEMLKLTGEPMKFTADGEKTTHW